VDPRLRVATKLPLDELWNEHGPLAATKTRTVGKAEVQDLLRTEMVDLVVADVGQPLRWIEPLKRFDFWKDELSPRLAEPTEVDTGFTPDAWPDGCCYVAHEWRLSDGTGVVVAEAYH
jgi:hypothetical protein